MRASEPPKIKIGSSIPKVDSEFRYQIDGLIVFARKPVQIRTLILGELQLIGAPTGSNEFVVPAIKVFRCFREDGKKLRHEGSRIKFKLSGSSLILSELYVTPSLGIAIALDSELAKFEFTPEDMKHSPDLELLTFDGVGVYPKCDYDLV